MPNQPKTPMKSFRIPEELYRSAMAQAAENGETISDVVRRELERYVLTDMRPPRTDWLDRAASLQAQLNLVRKWRSWYVNGETPSPSEWRELDRLLSTEGV